MRIARLIVLVGLILAAAAPARAAGLGWWGYLERLSGPGPFFGRSIAGELEAFCVDAGNNVLPPWKCWFPSTEIKHRVLFRFGTGSTANDQQLFFDSKDDRREVRARTFEVEYLFRPIPAVELGTGYGRITFSGDQLRGRDSASSFSAFDFTRTYMPLTVSVAPIALFSQSRGARVVRIEGGGKLFFDGFTGTDFGDSVTRYKSGAELVPSLRIVVDVSALIFATRK